MTDSSTSSGEQSLTGKVALITGGAHGIGRAIAARYLRAGAQVCVLDCDREAGEQTAAQLTTAQSTPVRFIQADLEHARDIHAAATALQGLCGRIDILVNNAGIEISKPLAEMAAGMWDRTIAINLRAPFLLTQALVPLFPTAGGAIVNMSSIHATHAFPDSLAYACSKAGLVALTRNLALELAPRRIRVNAVCPGYIDTRLWDEYLRSSPDADGVAAQVTALHPLGRRGTPEDVAEAALFLATDAAAFVTGTHLVVDGGLTIRAHP